MDMELLNAISEMIAKNNDILRQEINGLRQEMKQNNDSLRQEMLEDHNRLFNQFSALIEEKVTKEIHLVFKSEYEKEKVRADHLTNVLNNYIEDLTRFELPPLDTLIDPNLPTK